jgi:hypothetical protein
MNTKILYKIHMQVPYEGVKKPPRAARRDPKVRLQR